MKKPFLTLPHQTLLRPPLPRLSTLRMASSPFSEKVIVIMGPTGCGKTKLSIELASKLGNSEIINSDKIQLYNGLEITTNKVKVSGRKNIPHHLLGSVDPFSGEFSPSEYRVSASETISDIFYRNNLPIIAGGSNSYIYSLLVDQFQPGLNVFDRPEPVSNVLRYKCCFLWVDVEFDVLCEYLIDRVDEMLDSGMLEELSEYYKAGSVWVQAGLRKAIGVPEFEEYFQKYPPGYEGGWDQVREGVYEEAVRLIKDNTCELARRQIGKIEKMREGGWDLQKVDATATFEEIARRRKRRRRKKRWMEVWEEEVVIPSMKIVRAFLEE